MDTLSLALEALRRGDITDQLRISAAQEAHKLAGSLGTFGFAGCSQIASEIEKMLSLKDVIGNRVGILADLLAQLQRELNQQ